MLLKKDRKALNIQVFYYYSCIFHDWNYSTFITSISDNNRYLIVFFLYIMGMSKVSGKWYSSLHLSAVKWSTECTVIKDVAQNFFLSLNFNSGGKFHRSSGNTNLNNFYLKLFYRWNFLVQSYFIRLISNHYIHHYAFYD